MTSRSSISIVGPVASLALIAVLLAGSTPATAATTGWTSLSPMQYPRSGLGAATGNDGIIYTIGGYAAFNRTFSMGEAYDPATNTWTDIESMPLGVGGYPAVTAGLRGNIYALGGLGASTNVQVYHPGTDDWTVHARCYELARVSRP